MPYLRQHRRCRKYDCVMMLAFRLDHHIDHAWYKGHGWVVHARVQPLRCAPIRSQGSIDVPSELVISERVAALKYRRQMLVRYWYLPAGGCWMRETMMIASPSHCRSGAQARGSCNC